MASRVKDRRMRPRSLPFDFLARVAGIVQRPPTKTW